MPTAVIIMETTMVTTMVVTGQAGQAGPMADILQVMEATTVITVMEATTLEAAEVTIQETHTTHTETHTTRQEVVPRPHMEEEGVLLSHYPKLVPKSEKKDALNACLATITRNQIIPILILHAITIANALEAKSVAIITDTENAFIHIITAELSPANVANLSIKN